jgi:hypothetical protein
VSEPGDRHTPAADTVRTIPFFDPFEPGGTSTDRPFGRPLRVSTADRVVPFFILTVQMNRMDASSLAADADGASVTADRLTDPIVGELREGEQPHHLVHGKSCDVDVGADVERVYAAVDADATALATDRRVLFVVPQVGGTRTTSIPYGDIQSVSVTDDSPHEFRVRSDGTEYCFNVSSGEDPGPIGAFVRDRSAATQSPTTDGSGGVDAATGVRRGGRRRRGATPPGPDAGGDANETPRSGTGRADGSDTSPGAPPGSDPDPDPDPNPDPDADPATTGGAAPETDVSADPDPLDTLERLSELHEKGVLDDEEFERKKAELLDQV